MRIDPSTAVIEEGFTRDMRNIGQVSIGDLLASLKTMADFEEAQPLLMRAVEGDYTV